MDRQKFPGLAQKQIFLDNAGGSQVLQEVVDWCVTEPLSQSRPTPFLLRFGRIASEAT